MNFFDVGGLTLACAIVVPCLCRAPGDSQPLASGEALVLAIYQLVQFNPGEFASGGLEPLVHRLRDTIEGVPAFRLLYTSNFSALPNVAALLDEVVA